MIFTLAGPGCGTVVTQNDQLAGFNCHSIALHPDRKMFVVSATNRNSQGNGAVRDKAGAYLGNNSPLHVFEIVAENPAASA